MCSARFIIDMDVFVGFLDLFSIKDGVGERLAPKVLYLLLCAFISFMLTRNVILGIFYFPKLQTMCLMFNSLL
jgi:hypothetical protein